MVKLMVGDTRWIAKFVCLFVGVFFFEISENKD